jgi:hypothetical protein
VGSDLFPEAFIVGDESAISTSNGLVFFYDIIFFLNVCTYVFQKNVLANHKRIIWMALIMLPMSGSKGQRLTLPLYG